MPHFKGENVDRAGRVTALVGVAFQNDGGSTIGQWLIRPFETIDRRAAGVRPSQGGPPLAMHAGLHVRLEDGREVVAEQLVGPLYMDFKSGLNWTPIEQFRERDRGGWDVTVPAACFRGVDDAALTEVIDNLNRIQGHPFAGEDCTAFIERAFRGRRLFADSPLLRCFGISVRLGDPALPLLKPDAQLEPRARRLLHADALRDLPDGRAHPSSPSVRFWLRRALPAAALGVAAGLLLARR